MLGKHTQLRVLGGLRIKAASYSDEARLIVILLKLGVIFPSVYEVGATEGSKQPPSRND